MPERADLAPSTPGEMPEPTPELTLLSVLVRAHLSTLSPKKQRAYLAKVMATFEEMDEASNVVRIRGREYDAAIKESRRRALAWLRAMMGAFWQLDAMKRRR